MQADPIGYAGGANLYGYVGNDPLNLVDSMGLASQSTGTSASPLESMSYGELFVHQQQASAYVQTKAMASIVDAIGALGEACGGTPHATGGTPVLPKGAHGGLRALRASG